MPRIIFLHRGAEAVLTHESAIQMSLFEDPQMEYYYPAWKTYEYTIPATNGTYVIFFCAADAGPADVTGPLTRQGSAKNGSF